MSHAGGWNNDRFEHGFFGVDSVYVPCSIMALDDYLYDVLTGDSASGVEYFADVTFGGSSTTLSNIDEIYIERNIESVFGTCHIGFHTATSPISGLIKGAEILVTAGIRYNGVMASQKRFHGRIDQVKYPSLGETRGTIEAYDNGQVFTDSVPGSSTLIGDALVWIENRCNALSLGSTFRLISKTSGVSLTNSHLLSYSSFAEAMKTVVNGFTSHYAFFSGMNELIILDPAFLSTASPVFTLKAGGIQKLQLVEDGIVRVNRIPYSNYTGYAKNFVTYTVNVADNGSSSISATSITGTGFLSGVYNDTADQKDYGGLYPVLPHPGVQNNICSTDGQLQTFCASVAEESQRTRYSGETCYNPFIDLATVLQYDSSNYFISRIRDRISAGQLWKTQMEIRSI